MENSSNTTPTQTYPDWMIRDFEKSGITPELAQRLGFRHLTAS